MVYRRWIITTCNNKQSIVFRNKSFGLIHCVVEENSFLYYLVPLGGVMSFYHSLNPVQMVPQSQTLNCMCQCNFYCTISEVILFVCTSGAQWQSASHGLSVCISLSWVFSVYSYCVEKCMFGSTGELQVNWSVNVRVFISLYSISD